LKDPLKAACNRECSLCIRIIARDGITQYELSELFNKAYLKVTKMEKKRNIRLKNCRAAYLFSLNQEIFIEIVFEANEETK
jgi:hypothetical protein